MAECQKCPFATMVSALTAVINKYPRKVKKDGKTVLCQLNVAELTRHESSSKSVRKAAEALEPKFKRLREYVVETILPLAQKVCIRCCETSDDDNLSRGGHTFVSLDAMASGVTLSDGSKETGDGLNVRVIRQDSTGGDGVTQLPSHIEDTILKVMHDFMQLDVFEKNLVLHQMTGASLVDFGTMRWVPHEMMRSQSKEFVSFRWNRLLSKFPLAAALRKSKGAAAGRSSSRASDEPYIQQLIDFPEAPLS